jgi:hypothetical protein
MWSRFSPYKDVPAAELKAAIRECQEIEATIPNAVA